MEIKEKFATIKYIKNKPNQTGSVAVLNKTSFGSESGSWANQRKKDQEPD
jgi:hypothetical protein